MNNLLTSITGLFLIVTMITTTSCHKKTSSDFRLERYSYAPGETLDLINLSPNKRHQIWEIINPDGGSDTIVNGQAPQLTLDVLGKDGIYTLKVFDNKKEKTKNISSDKKIMVSAVRGKVIIYSNPFAGNSFTVYIDDQSVVGKDGVQYQLPIGVHAIKASCIYYSGGPTHTLDTVVTINSQFTTYLQLN